MEDATIYTIYSEYFGKKSSVLDSVSQYKDKKTQLEESDKIYSLITIIKLYCNAGFFPVNLVEKENEINFRSDSGVEINLDFDSISTEEDKSLAILNALTLQRRYIDQVDKTQAVMADLNVEINNGKDFGDLVGKFTKTDEDTRNKIITKLKTFLEYLVSNNITGLVNLIFNEVLDDYEGRL